jgi:hypothetical protein
MRERALRAVVLFAIAAALGGCSAVPTAPASASASDSDQTAALERAARRNGVRILWFNPPQPRAVVPGS